MLTRFATMTAVALLMAGPVAAQTATDPAAAPSTTTPTTPADPAAPAATPATPTTPAPATDAAPMGDTAAVGGTMRGAYIERQEANQILASEMIGSSVRGSGDETIGEINNILLDREGNRIVGAVIGVGGFLGVGEKEVAISFDDLQVTKDENGDDMLTFARTKEELEAAPDFQTLDDIESEAQASAPAPAATAPAPATSGSTVQ